MPTEKFTARHELYIPPEGIRCADLSRELTPLAADTIITILQEPPLTQFIFDEIGVIINRASRTVTGPKGISTPTWREYEVVDYLASKADTIQERSAIMRHAWAETMPESSHVLDVHVSRLRHKLSTEAGVSPEVIRTVYGVGFLFRSTLTGKKRK